MLKKLRPLVAIIGIISIGAFFRFINLNWDNNFHLHPDERFLTMVGNAMVIPNNFSQYLSPQTSLFNPANIDFSFFVYGIFPLVLNKLIALMLGNDSYNSFTMQGRALSALLDLLIIVLVFKTAYVFEKKLQLHALLKYFSAYFYAVSVLPIQLSHFFAVDTFLNFFMFFSFYCCAKFWQKRNVLFLIGGGIFTGLAIASKVNGVFIIPLNLVFLTFAFIDSSKVSFSFKTLCSQIGLLFTNNVRVKFAISILLYIISCYLALRVADPYLFENASFLDAAPSKAFLSNIETLKSFSDPNTTFPPSLQWIDKPPVFFSLYNLALFGLGIPLFALLFFGLAYTFTHIKKLSLFFVTIWVILLFLFQSIQFVQSMRYYLYLYPYFALFSGIAIIAIYRKWSKKFTYALLAICIIWPLFFISIYLHPHPRVEASVWMYENAPSGSIVLVEHWDDGLPLRTSEEKSFTITELHVFDDDTNEKWSEMNRLLSEGDYLIISSNRGYGSIPNDQKRLPRMTQFYKDLFANKTDYKLIKKFSSYPSLNYLGLPLTLDDSVAEEAFSVYDHPTVFIFKR